MAKEINWDDQDAAKRDDSFRGKAQKWDRFTIMDPNAVMAETHYTERIRYWECTQRTEGACTECAKGEEPRERYGAIICLYNTNELGAPFNPLSFKITWWAFGPDKFAVIRMAKQNFGDLRKHDIIVQCTEEKFQKMTIQAMPDAWWLKEPAFTAQVAKAYKEFTAHFDLAKKLARKIPFVNQAQVLAGRDGQRNDQGGGQPRAPQPGYQSRPDFAPSFASAPPPSNPAPAPSPSAPPAPIPPSAPSGDTVDLDSMLNDLK